MAWFSIYIHIKFGDVITHPRQIFNNGAVEVGVWMSNHIIQNIRGIITYSFPFQLIYVIKCGPCAYTKLTIMRSGSGEFLFGIEATVCIITALMNQGEP